MRRIVMILMMLGLVQLSGCDKPQEQTAEPTDNTTQANSTPTKVSPLELLPNEQDEPKVDFEFAIPATNAVHPIARRSAFPEEGENFQQPIPAKKLSDNDPFAIKIDPANIPKIVPWTDAANYVGYEITVEGKIVDTGQSKDGKVNFLNFHKEWHGKFYMVVFDDLAKTLPKSIDETFIGKTLRVKGMVEDHKGRPQIKILSMDQVQFVGG